MIFICCSRNKERNKFCREVFGSQCTYIETLQAELDEDKEYCYVYLHILNIQRKFYLLLFVFSIFMY